MQGFARKSRGGLFAAFLTFCPPFLPVPPGTTEVIPRDLSNTETATILYRNNSLEIKTAKSVYLHYGFNGWNYVTSGADAGYGIDLGNGNYYKRTKMEFRPALNAYALEIEIPKTVRALHYAICWDECLNGQWDNNDKKDFSWPITFPYIGPILTWDQNTSPDSGIVVTFENSWKSGAWLEYRTDGGAAKRLTSSSAQSHKFHLNNLSPNTRYFYRVGIEGDVQVSAEYSFTTAKSAKIGDFSFILFGDPQDNGDNGHSTRVYSEILANHTDADFVVSTGDLTFNDVPGLWWTFFDKAKELLASKPFLSTTGNHDTPGVDSDKDTSSFRSYFNLPYVAANNTFYKFNFGNAQFISMNSEIPEELGDPSGEQFKWLAGELNSSQPVWRFLFWHVPPFNIGARHWQQRHLFRSTAELFTGKVDWEFSGHEHLYQRMAPIRMEQGTPVVADKYGRKSGEGVGYLITPSGGVQPESAILKSTDQGGNERNLLAFPDLPGSTSQVPSHVGFLKVHILGSEISITTYAFDALDLRAPWQVIDTVNYVKDAP